MKLKRFLALAVSLAMVITMIPAFSVSAAGTTGVINALGGEVLWACPDGTFNDTAVATAWPGWTSSATEGNVNLRSYTPGNTLQFYTNGSTNMIATVTSPGYGGNGEDAIVIEWTMKRDNPSDLYFDFSFTDKDGAEIAFVKFDRNYTSVQGEYYMGYPVDGTDCAIVATNNGDGTHNVEYYVAGEVVSTVDGKAGTVNGFGGISSSNGRWSKAWNHIGFANLTIGAVSFSETRVDVEASYTVNGEVVHTETGHYDPAEGETGVAFPAYGYSANGTNTMYYTAGATLSENGEIALEVVDNAGTHAVGDVFAKDGVQYEIKSANLIPNGDFAYGANGWYASNGGAAGFFTANGDGTMTLTAGGTGVAGANSLYRAWAVETGKKYLITFDTDAPNEYHKVSVTDALATDDSANVFLNLGGTNNGSAVNGTNSVVFDATTAYVMVNFRWLGTGQKFGNFGLYEIAEATVTVEETVADIAEVAPVKVIGDTAVVLPATVEVTGSLGSVVNAPVVWDAPASYEVGTTEVEGTATVQFGEQDAVTETVSATVTVLNESFTIDDVTTVNGQTEGKNQQKLFPVAIPDEFSMEFTANYASFGDLWITIKTADAGFFGPEQLPLGVNASGAFRPVNGNGSGGRAVADSDLAYLTAGTPYRFFITTDASTDKYTVTVYDEATGAEVATAENFGYRTNATAIEAITSITNNGAGSVTLTNIKVSSAYADSLKTDYTVVTTVNGATESTTTVTAFSADGITAEEREGYMLTKTVEGNTITFAYVSTVDVTITYTVNGATVKTVTNEYDPLVSAGAEFDAVTYYANGVNTIYEAAAATYSESQSVELTALANNGTHELGDIVVGSDGTQYEIASANLVPNGDFSLGLTGWYNAANGEAAKFAVQGDGTIKATADGGAGSDASLYRAWAIERDKTYLFTYTADVAQQYHKVSVKDDISATADGTVLTNNSENNNGSYAGTNNIVFTAANDYIQINFRWLASSNVIGNFGLYEVVPATVTITEEIESVEAPAAITAFGSNAVVLPATVKVTGTLGSNVDGTVAWEEPATYPAGATTVNGTVTAQFGTAEPLTAPVSIQVTVVDEFTLADSESFGKQPGNVVYFPMAIGSEFTMEFDYTINEIADASVQMGNNGAIFGNAALGISPNGGVLKVTGGNKAGTSEGVTLVESVKVGDVFHMALTMDASDDTYTLVVETADGTIVTTGEKGFRTAQDTINTMTVLKNGNNADDKGTIVVSNIKVTATPVELCTVTVDGVEKQVIKGRSYKNATEGVVVIDEAGAIYVPVDGVITVPVYSDMVLTTKAIGLAMVSGAQVRVGATELAEGEKLDALADSGLRFLATADYNDTLLVDADEFGIKITAEGSSNVAYVKAETFQNDDNSVFSAAITNLAESNYNRKYTATAYVKIGNVEVTTGSVTRSIYQVSAGLMQGNGTAENGDAYTIDGVVKNILNAYVNQTGIRLSYDAETGITVEEGKYTGAVFFTVESESDGDDGFNVTITPDASWGTPAEIAQWWTDYVRFNNNNSVAKGYISNAAFADGTLTFNFDTTVD